MRWHTQGQWVDAWRGTFRQGPCAMLEALLDDIDPKLDKRTRELMRAFVGHMREQGEWIDKAYGELTSEAARIREFGEMMRVAGLRSYTDKEGRVYVAKEER